MNGGGPAIEEEGLDLIERLVGGFFKEAETEGLRDRRIYAIEDRDCTSAVEPCCVGGWIESAACFGKAAAGEAFCAFQALSEKQIGKGRHTGYGITRVVLDETATISQEKSQRGYVSCCSGRLTLLQVDW